MEVYCCHGNSYDVTISLKALPDKRVVKVFIVYLHDQKYFSVISPHFKSILKIKTPYEPP